MPDVTRLDPEIQRLNGSRQWAVERLATKQHGVIARRQLLQLGIGAGAIEYRLSNRTLHRLFRGVYALGHSRVAGRGRWMAAVLAGGDGAVLSHRSAAALWEIAPTASARIDVTTVRRNEGQPGIAFHGVRRVDEADRTVRDEIPVTTLARTLLDLAEAVSLRQLERAVEEAERLQLLDLNALEDACRRNRGRRGLKQLRAVIETAAPPPNTRSELERRFIRICRESGLPSPALNCFIEGFEVDAVWPEQRLVVELDGYEFHHTHRAFERDRARDMALQLAGYRVLRVTHQRLLRDPSGVVRAVSILLATPAA
jgi:very-short-patch-repair endonuclease/predicted transcriptional regulator of viral defense system